MKVNKEKTKTEAQGKRLHYCGLVGSRGGLKSLALINGEAVSTTRIVTSRSNLNYKNGEIGC